MKKVRYIGININYDRDHTVENVKDLTQNCDDSNDYMKEVLCLPG